MLFCSRFSTNFHVKILGTTLTLLIIYEPYKHKLVFWEKIFSLKCVQEGKVMFWGVDLNFTLNRDEIWGISARVDRNIDFFNFFIEDVGLVDVEPISMAPTWQNN
jgi:hypothetical protein